MKLQSNTEGFEGNLPESRIAFKIASNPQLFQILSDGIYKDKILAVIRELCCNAHDSHVVSKQTRPFFVNVPTQLDPTFIVEDYGTGVDPDKIGDIFWTYGSSTKTEDDSVIGALGLGSKSPFAYTKSSFTVKNRWNGKEYIYFCFINERGYPDGSLIDTKETQEHDGITVEVAVKQEDVSPFVNRIKRFFSTWGRELPKFSDEEFDVYQTPVSFENGVGTSKQHFHHHVHTAPLAVMGGVSYPIDISSIPNATNYSHMLYSECLKHSNNIPVLKFEIGELSFTSSREELSYDEKTVSALQKRSKDVFYKIATEFLEVIDAASTNYEAWLAVHDLIKTKYNFFSKYSKVGILKLLDLSSRIDFKPVHVEKYNSLVADKKIEKLFDYQISLNISSSLDGYAFFNVDTYRANKKIRCITTSRYEFGSTSKITAEYGQIVRCLYQVTKGRQTKFNFSTKSGSINKLESVGYKFYENITDIKFDLTFDSSIYIVDVALPNYEILDMINNHDYVIKFRDETNVDDVINDFYEKIKGTLIDGIKLIKISETTAYKKYFDINNKSLVKKEKAEKTSLPKTTLNTVMYDLINRSTYKDNVDLLAENIYYVSREDMSSEKFNVLQQCYSITNECGFNNIKKIHLIVPTISQMNKINKMEDVKLKSFIEINMFETYSELVDIINIGLLQNRCSDINDISCFKKISSIIPESDFANQIKLIETEIINITKKIKECKYNIVNSYSFTKSTKQISNYYKDHNYGLLSFKDNPVYMLEQKYPLIVYYRNTQTRDFADYVVSLELFFEKKNCND